MSKDNNSSGFSVDEDCPLAATLSLLLLFIIFYFIFGSGGWTHNIMKECTGAAELNPGPWLLF